MTEDELNGPDEMNEPDMQRVAYEVAIEYMAKVYQDFRAAGLSRRDAAAIVAHLINAGDADATS